MRNLLYIFLLFLSACSIGSIHTLYQPGNPDIHLWGPDRVTVDPSWRYLGATDVSVSGKVRDYELIAPLEQSEMLVFTKENTNGTELLLVGRVVKGIDSSTFVYLGGDKKVFQGKTWRVATYGLRPETADREMSAYLNLATSKGCTLAQEYRADILDRLPQSSVLLRVIHLTPGSYPVPLPSFGELYPQERIDNLKTRDF